MHRVRIGPADAVRPPGVSSCWRERLHRCLPAAVAALVLATSIGCGIATIAAVDLVVALEVEHAAAWIATDAAPVPRALRAERGAFEALDAKPRSDTHSRLARAQERLTAELLAVKERGWYGSVDVASTPLAAWGPRRFQDLIDAAEAAHDPTDPRDATAAVEVDAEIGRLVAALPQIARDVRRDARTATSRLLEVGGATFLLAMLALVAARVLRRHPLPVSPIYASLLAHSNADMSIRSWIVGWCMRMAGSSLITLATLSLGLAFAATRSGPLTFEGRVVLLVGGSAFAAIFGSAGIRAWRAGKNRLAQHAALAAARSRRAPVLYLRSFADDALGATATPPTHMTAVLTSIRRFSEEEQLTMAMRKIGPFVAIGRPGEQMPQLGATRFYLPGDDWQSTVFELMANARLVVLRIGATEGLWCEIEHALETVAPERLAILLPPDENTYEAFRLRTATLQSARRLPNFPARRCVTRFDALCKGVLYFESDRTPRLVSFAEPLFPETPRWLMGVFLRSLRPIAKQLGVSRVRLLRTPESVLQHAATLAGVALIALIAYKLVYLMSAL